MSETTTEQTPAQATQPVPPPPAATQPETPAETPPWGDDFDPDRAWGTIKNLREREKELSKNQLTPEQRKHLEEYQRLVEASQSDQERQERAIAEAQRTAETAQAQALRYEVALEHGLTKDDFELLGSGTKEELSARATYLAQLKAAATAAASAQPAAPATPTPGQRPVEQLRPGATPSAAVSEDDANYARLFGPDAP